MWQDRPCSRQHHTTSSSPTAVCVRSGIICPVLQIRKLKFREPEELDLRHKDSERQS